MFPNVALMRALQSRPAPVNGLAPVGGVQYAPGYNPSTPGAPGTKLGDAFGGLAGRVQTKNAQNNPQLPYFDEDRQRIMEMLGARSAFAGEEWGGLIGQLQRQASGQGPSLAEQQYRSAAQDTTNSLSSMARGSASPAAARQAMIQRGRVGQGMAAGVATARTQEQMAATSALSQALSSRDQINSNAYLDLLAAQLGLSRAQLDALTGNADRAANKKIADRQAKAAKWSAIGGLAGGLGSLF